MTKFICTLPVLCALALPVAAQEAEEDAPSLMERGARLFLEGLMSEMEPALDDLQGMAEQMEPSLREFSERLGPALGELMGKVDDLSAYDLPEVLPNGDIIIRRKPDAAPYEPEKGEIEL